METATTTHTVLTHHDVDFDQVPAGTPMVTLGDWCHSLHCSEGVATQRVFHSGQYGLEGRHPTLDGLQWSDTEEGRLHARRTAFLAGVLGFFVREEVK